MIRIFFSGLAIIIDDYPAPVEAGTLTASLVGQTISVANAANGAVLVAALWNNVSDVDGQGFSSPAAVLQYLQTQLSALPPSRVTTVRVASVDPVVIDTSDYGALVGVRKTVPGPTTIPLPDDQPQGFYVAIKDMRGDASTNNITLTSALLIDGASQYALVNDWQSETLYRTDTGWAIV